VGHRSRSVDGGADSGSHSTIGIPTGPYDPEVGDGWRTDALDAAIVVRTGTQIVEESFAATQQDGHDHKVHLIDQ
jgi:hypothetical protein